jgi:hypothetical protein
MTTAVIGATGRVGSEIVRGVLARGDAVAALVRDPDKARRAFGEPDGLHIRPTRLDDPRDLTEALDGIRTVFIAMGSIGIEGVLQRIAINAAAGSSSIEQVTRSGCSTPRRTHWGSTSAPTTASTSSPPRPPCRTRGSAPRSSRRRCSPQRPRCTQLTGHPRARWPSSFTSTTRNSSDARALGQSERPGRSGFFEVGLNSRIQDCGSSVVARCSSVTSKRVGCVIPVHAARRYSCRSPPSRSRRCMRPSWSSLVSVRRVDGAGGFSSKARCGRWAL